MTERFEVPAEDVHEVLHVWGWWQGRDLDGDEQVLALEMQALGIDVVAVLDVVIELVDDDRLSVTVVVLFGPATEHWSAEERDRFRVAESHPRVRRVFAGDPQRDGWQHFGPGHWQLQLLEPDSGPALVSL